MEPDIIVVTTNYVPGYNVTEVLGPVMGLESNSRGFGGNVTAGLKSIVGGEIKQFSEAVTILRETILQRMKEEAVKIGADAVISIKFDTSAASNKAAKAAVGMIPFVGGIASLAISDTYMDLVVYGTAVKIEKSDDKTRGVSYG